MNDQMTAAERSAALHRKAAAEFAERLRPHFPRLLGNLPGPAASPEQVRERLERLGSALLGVPAELSPLRQDPSSAPAFFYAAALSSYGLALAEFRKLEPDPMRSAVLLSGFAAHHREQLGGHLPAVSLFLALESTDREPTPEQAREALESFPHALPLASFLAAHHVLSVAAELLGGTDFRDPAATFRSLLETLRGEVYAVPLTVPRAEA